MCGCGKSSIQTIKESREEKREERMLGICMEFAGSMEDSRMGRWISAAKGQKVKREFGATWTANRQETRQ
jgi:hypothetical protein